MANNSVSALNTGIGNAAFGNEAANASAANAATKATANASATPAADPGTWVADFCAGYGEALLLLAVLFLGAALLLGIGSSLIALQEAAKPKAGGAGPRGGGVLPDPGKLVDALKGLIEALAKAPAWIALFIGGIFLLWMAGSFADAICTPARSDGRSNSSSTSTNMSTTITNASTANTTRPKSGTQGNSQAPAINVQEPVTNGQGRSIRN